MSAGRRSVVIHGHFYQPPREDPWLDTVPLEPSAAPSHDWNERIERECYRAVVAARIPAADGRIARIVNTLTSISFNFGPTLLWWLEREAPSTHAAIQRADRKSRDRLGHGNAIAMPYHHSILPLASRRDKATEVRWGMADFRRRFGREPEGMWLPETAVDDETLDVLAEEGIAFTVLAPHQVEKPPAGGLPGLYRTGRGRKIALFLYDGGISHDVAFGSLLDDAWVWAERMTAHEPGHSGTQLVSVATDGETFGHHKRFGEMALAAVLAELHGREDVRVENFASFLARHAPREEVTLLEPSSWSCNHGVERWKANCGCKVAPDRPSQQEWRAALREAVEWLAEQLHQVFEAEGGRLLGRPWAARDAYGAVAGTSGEAVERFVRQRTGAPFAPADEVRVRELLELERNALRLFTSCAWFFDDIAGIEPLQILRYAARALDLVGPEGPELEEGFRQRLAAARSNDPDAGDGRRLYDEQVRPTVPAAALAAAGLAAAAAIAPEERLASIGAYQGSWSGGDVVVVHGITGRAHRFSVSLEHPGRGPVELTVRSANGEIDERLTLDDLPEEAHDAVAAALKRGVVATWFTEAETSDLLTGRCSLADGAVRAMERSIEALRSDDLTTAVPRVQDLAFLLDLLGVGIPFSAQTAFWHVRRDASGERAKEMEALATVLGFADEEAAP